MTVTTFYKAPMQDGIDEAGVPFYRDITMVRIFRDTTHTVERIAEESDYELYEAEYRFFEKRHAKDEVVEGFVIEMWPMLTPADVMNLRGHGVRTVQQLAKMQKQGLPAPIADLVEKAKTYVKLAGAGGTQLAAKVAELTEMNVVLVEENRTLKNTIENLKVKAA